MGGRQGADPLGGSRRPSRVAAGAASAKTPTPAPPRHTHRGAALEAAGLRPEVQGLRLPTGSPGAWSWRPGEPRPQAERGAWGAPKRLFNRGPSSPTPPPQEPPSARRGVEGAAAGLTVAAARPQGPPAPSAPIWLVCSDPGSPAAPSSSNSPAPSAGLGPRGPPFVRGNPPPAPSSSEGSAGRGRAGRTLHLTAGDAREVGPPNGRAAGTAWNECPGGRGSEGLGAAPRTFPAAPPPAGRREPVRPPGLFFKNNETNKNHPTPTPESGPRRGGCWGLRPRARWGALGAFPLRGRARRSGPDAVGTSASL